MVYISISNYSHTPNIVFTSRYCLTSRIFYISMADIFHISLHVAITLFTFLSLRVAITFVTFLSLRVAIRSSHSYDVTHWIARLSVECPKTHYSCVPILLYTSWTDNRLNFNQGQNNNYPCEQYTILNIIYTVMHSLNSACKNIIRFEKSFVRFILSSRHCVLIYFRF